VSRLVDKRNGRVRLDLEAVKWPALRQMLCALPFAATPVAGMTKRPRPACLAAKRPSCGESLGEGSEAPSLAKGLQLLSQRLAKLELAMGDLATAASSQGAKVTRGKCLFGSQRVRFHRSSCARLISQAPLFSLFSTACFFACRWTSC
jgi:hypothetical protein